MHSSLKAPLAAAAAGLGLLATVACGPSGAHHADAVSASAAARSAEAQITSSPQFRKSEAAAKQCVSTGGSLLAVWHCIAPPGHSKARNACIRKMLVANLGSKAGRAAIPALAASCAESNA